MQKHVILTNMVLVKNDKDEYLVLFRERNDWPGLTFPGGHTEDNETITESAYRELFEESGLKGIDLRCVGFFEWNNIDSNRHLSLLYYTDKYEGEILSSFEGKVFFLKEEEFKNYPLSTDFFDIFNTFKRGID